VRALGRLRQRPPTSTAAWLVVGLGNPGPRYEATRHNLGRVAVERAAQRHGVALSTARFGARFGLGRVGDERIAFATPTTYMNESGRAVAALARFYQVPPGRVLVVYDDLDLPLGALRLRPEGGAGGHNGVADVIRALGGAAFPRLRLGIGRPPPGWDAADYVLARFAEHERAAADETALAAADAVDAVLGSGLEAAMNTVNRG
jgi:PTH1 family peptidyl-tRNA hydrolase